MKSLNSTESALRVGSRLGVLAPIGVSLALLTGCISPYRIEIQQGNYIAGDAMSQVKPGMTKEQVRAILGTPLINDIFHADRWDYVFTRAAANSTEVVRRRATLLFKGDVLTSIDADVMPADAAKTVPGHEARKK